MSKTNNKLNFINIHSHSAENRDGIVIYNALNINNIPKTEENFYVSTALHPWYLKPELWNNNIKEYEEVIAQENIIAIGECGIDLNINIKAEIQKTIFTNHLHWADKYNKPLIIHCVKTHNEIISLKKKANVKQACIIHGFNNNINIARQLLAAGFYLSFGEALLHNSSNAATALKITPLDKIFFETDESEHPIKEIYEKAAIMLNISIEELIKQIQTNFKKIFIKE